MYVLNICQVHACITRNMTVDRTGNISLLYVYILLEFLSICTNSSTLTLQCSVLWRWGVDTWLCFHSQVSEYKILSCLSPGLYSHGCWSPLRSAFLTIGACSSSSFWLIFRTICYISEIYFLLKFYYLQFNFFTLLSLHLKWLVSFLNCFVH